MGECVQCGGQIRKRADQWCSEVCRLLVIAERRAFGRKVPLRSIREPQVFPLFTSEMRSALLALEAMRHRVRRRRRAA